MIEPGSPEIKMNTEDMKKYWEKHPEESWKTNLSEEEITHFSKIMNLNDEK